MRRPTINIIPLERAGRIVIGAIGAIFGLFLLASAPGTSADGASFAVLETLLVLVGLTSWSLERSDIARCIRSSAACHRL